MKHLFIINPKAGKGKTLKLIPEIERIFKNKKEEYFIEITNSVGNATEIVSRYVAKDNYRVYSVGGDGTLNEVLNGMINSSSTLAVIPSGTGNDFIKNLTGNNKDILIRTIEGLEKEVDLGKVNDRYFINIASIGFDAEVLYNARKLKKVPFIKGGLAYILAVVLTIFKGKSNFLNIKIDNKIYTEKTLLIAVANGKYYGGGMKITPEALIDDGIFDICLVKAMNRFKILRVFPELIKGTHERLKEVSFYKGKEVTICSEKYISLNVDGEVFRVKEANFKIINKGIKIIYPKS